MYNYYVYEHWRLDTDTCFYVGLGQKQRAYDRRGRNIHWKNIVAKLERIGSGYEVRMVATGLTEQEAFSLEIERIAFWQDKVDLANITKGGSGGPAMFGVNHPMFGKKRPDLAQRNRDRVWSEESRKKAAEKAADNHPSEETRRKMSESRKGIVSPNKGKNNPKVSEANKLRAGTEAAKLAAKKASMIRWGKLHSVDISSE